MVQAAPLGLYDFPKLVGESTRIRGEKDLGGFVLSCFYRLSSSFVTQMWVVHSRNTHDSYSPPSQQLAPSSNPSKASFFPVFFFIIFF